MTAFADDPMLARLTQQTDRLLETVRIMDDEAAHAPSLLPGWTRGHVLTHLARNADGLANVVRTAITGEVTPAYVSRERRDEDIETGAGRSVADLEADVETSAERLLALLADVPEDAIDVEVPTGTGRTFRVGDLPWVRTREVVYHHVDLAAGFGFADMPDDVLRAGLLECVPRLAEASPGVELTCTLGDGSVVELRVGDGAVQARGPASEVLGWLTGRGEGRGIETSASLPRLPSWG